MAKEYEVVAKVESIKRTCSAEHKVGDEFHFIGEKTPEGLCFLACSALCPFVWVLKYGGTFPWGTDPDVTHVACPDSHNVCIFELRRLRK